MQNLQLWTKFWKEKCVGKCVRSVSQICWPTNAPQFCCITRVTAIISGKIRLMYTSSAVVSGLSMLHRRRFSYKIANSVSQGSLRLHTHSIFHFLHLGSHTHFARFFFSDQLVILKPSRMLECFLREL